jgi:predicted phage tail protein
MNKKKPISIRGAGGGGKGGGGNSARIPVEESDTLQSQAFASVIDLLAEGEIEGLAAPDDHPLQAVYLDGTPIENPNGTQNFSGIEFQSRNGTQDQDYIPKFATIENEVSVGLKVPKASPVVRTISNELIDAVRVRIAIPQLTQQNVSTGDLTGSEVQYKIELQSNGGGFVTQVTDDIIGKTTSKYERDYRIELSGAGPWDIRVTRISDDSGSVAINNDIYWESYTELVDGKLRFPNSALAALRIDSSQFSQIPTRGYDLKLLKIQVPSNASVRADGSLTYSGNWDGTFQTVWSSNPAWCFYDLMTNTRYGLGNFIDPSLIDKWSLYTIGQYCDELVDDGFGALEPRYSCNLYIQTRNDAFKVLQDMASIFRGMTYWAEGTITVVQDAPADVAHIFNATNIVDGLFTYQGSSAKSRHTVALVSWNDPQNFYQQSVEYVEDQDQIARYGIIEAQISAVGCTSQGQAHRLGKWLLFSERFQTETVQFKTGLGGAICRPGQIIQISDPTRAGQRRGGRISTSTDSIITLDSAPIVAPLTSTISVLLPDGTVETRTILAIDGNNIIVATLTDGLPLSKVPQDGSVWTIQNADIEPQYFQVITITEADDGTYEVTALAFNPDKFDEIEKNLIIEPKNISSLVLSVDAPNGLALTETLYAVGTDVRTKITISWNVVSGATSYVVQYQQAGKNVIELPETSSNDVEILSAEPGFYTATVYAVNTLGQKSPPATATATIRGKAAAPGDVQGFSLIPLAGVAYLSWNQTTNLNVLIGGSVRIRFTPDILAPVWKNGVDITPALSGTTTRAQVPLLTGSYMAKFVNSNGVASDDEVIISTTVPAPLALNVVETITEDPGYSGTKTDCFVTSEFGGGLTIDSLDIDSWGLIDDVILWDFNGGALNEAEYDFANSIDLGASYAARVTAAIQVSGVDITESIDERLELIDDWVDLDGDFIDDVNAELFLRTSDDGLTWTDWKRFFVGEYTARHFQFKLILGTGNTAHNIVVKSVSVTLDMADRTVNLQGVISGAGAYNVIYPEAFQATPAVGITAYNLNSGDYWQISGESNAGFTITFKNSGGSNISRNFDVLAKGFGRAV